MQKSDTAPRLTLRQTRVASGSSPAPGARKVHAESPYCLRITERTRGRPRSLTDKKNLEGTHRRPPVLHMPAVDLPRRSADSPEARIGRRIGRHRIHADSLVNLALLRQDRGGGTAVGAGSAATPAVADADRTAARVSADGARETHVLTVTAGPRVAVWHEVALRQTGPLTRLGRRRGWNADAGRARLVRTVAEMGLPVGARIARHSRNADRRGVEGNVVA
jgi:hypothetical protein